MHLRVCRALLAGPLAYLAAVSVGWLSPSLAAPQPLGPQPLAQKSTQESTGESAAEMTAIFAEPLPRLVLSRGAGEGPAWHPRLGLLFSGDNRIGQWSPQRGLTTFRDQAGTNGLLFDREGRLLACEPVLRRLTRTTIGGELEVLADAYHGAAFNQPNDLTIDRRGRIYFSDPRYGSRDDMQQVDAAGRKIEGVYRIDPDGSVTRIITHEVDRPNGVLVSADDRWLYVADNNNNQPGAARKLWRFALRPDGTPDFATRKLIYDWGSGRGPDGMVQDQLGRLYVAGGRNQPQPPHETADRHPGGIYVFAPPSDVPQRDGRLLEVLRIPRDEVTNCTFGDADLKSLYITAGGTLWKIRTVTAGWLPWPQADQP